MTIPTELVELPKGLCYRVLFLIKGMLEKGSRRCIVYATSIEECEEFIKTFHEIMKRYHYLPYWISSITAETKEKEREERLMEFSKVDLMQMDRMYLLCSIRILDECVDL